MKLAYVIAAAIGCAASAAEPGYFNEIRPILQRNCQGCHQPNFKESDLDVTSYESLAAGGKHGPAPAVIVKYLTGELKPQMPFGEAPLTPEQIELVRRWVAAGAKDDTPPEAREALSPGKPTVYTQLPVVTAMAFSPDGKTLAVSGNREILLHALDGAAPVKRLQGLSERILSLEFSRDGTLLLAGGGSPARFGELQLWELPAGKLRRSIMITGDTIFGASLSPDGTRAAVGCTDNTVRIIDTKTGAEISKMGAHEGWVLGTVFGGDSKRIVSVGRDRAAKLTDARSGGFLENVNLLRGELAAVARNPAKETVVIGGDERVPYIYMMDRRKVMNIADDTTLIRKLDRQNGAIAALAWSPDGLRIAVAGAAPEINVYDAETGGRVAQCKGHSAGIYAVAFSPDSSVLATGGFDGMLRLYDAASCQLKKSFSPVPLEQPATATGGLQ